jgi:hypothetical protein
MVNGSDDLQFPVGDISQLSACFEMYFEALISEADLQMGTQ